MSAPNLDKFPWGKIMDTHEIGEYYIVEYLDKKGGTTLFHPYSNGKDLHLSCLTLDGALIAAICTKHDGHNTTLPYYIGRFLGPGVE